MKWFFLSVAILALTACEKHSIAELQAMEPAKEAGHEEVTSAPGVAAPEVPMPSTTRASPFP
jgi:hypothetical protein